MMRQAALQCFRSAKKPSKSKPFWLTNNIIKTSTTASKLISSRPYGLYPSLYISKSNTSLWFLTRQLHAHHFCTNTVSTLGDFTVTRSKPELVGPAKPTPREVKPLSAIDSQVMLRHYNPIIQFYRYNPSMEGKNPAKIIRDALANALVLYYPLAGRLTEGPDRKIFVDCTGEGVLFVEAAADVELSQLGDPPRPPFPWIDQLLYNIPVPEGIINSRSPLFFIQVTRLKCGGFILAFRFNHVMTDAWGLVQFLTAVGEIARGAHAPSITPTWCRELLSDVPLEISTNRPCEEVGHPTNNNTPFKFDDMIQRSIFIGPSKLLAIRKLVPDHQRPYTTMFEILTACLWRCRTAALKLDPEDVVPLMFVVNARNTTTNQVLPVGYYGNAMTAALIETSARQLCESPIEYALGLVKKAKEEGTKECMSWRTNPPVVKDHPRHYLEKCLMVSDLRRVGLGDVDFGWGKAAYAGPAKVEFDQVAFYLPYRNHNGEDEILVSICFRDEAMGRFEIELNKLLSHGSTYTGQTYNSAIERN